MLEHKKSRDYQDYYDFQVYCGHKDIRWLNGRVVAFNFPIPNFEAIKTVSELFYFPIN